MIGVHDIKRIDNLPFDKYLELPQYSFSFLKREQAGIAAKIKTSDKMEFGKLVDAIISDEEPDFNHKDYPAAKSVAAQLYKDFGDIVKLTDKQVSYTCELSFGGLYMPFKGRLDMLLPTPNGNIVIDLKICHQKNVDAVVSFMRYPDQMFGYSRPSEANKAYLLIYCIPLKQTILRYIDLNTDNNSFFEEKILKFGTVKP